MRNLIGNLLIIIARIITFARNLVLFFLTVGIVLGIAMITLLGLFDLTTPELNVLGKPIWDIIVLILGGATMWLGISKLCKIDEKNKKIKNKQYHF